MNKLYFGDNLDLLRNDVDDESVDFVYLDPPFNSDARYNVLFETPSAEKATAQAEAFRDTWTWDDAAAHAYDEIVTNVRGNTARFIEALRGALGDSDMMAYLVMMTIRLHELRRVLKPAGSIFLHCDPTASHYLKIVMDGIFGVDALANEIIWERSTGKSHMTRRLPTNHDVMLFYRKSDAFVLNTDEAFIPYDMANLPETIAAKYVHKDQAGRLYRLDNLINPNPDRPNLTYEFMGVTRVWRWTKDRMQQALADGRVIQTAPGRVPQYIRYLDEQRGMPLSDVWSDLPPLNSQAAERIGYPTQKPMALLDRILRLTTKPGAIVLDPFCGCGTTVEAAQALRRNWIGMDVAYHAIKVIENRLEDTFRGLARYDVRGIPADFPQAEALAARDKYQFQWWANYLFDPHSVREIKKGADRGIDGELYFPLGAGKQGFGRILISVKGGKNIGPSMIRDFRGVLEREKAAMGLFVCLRNASADCRREAHAAGFVDTPQGRKPRLQIVSIMEWFDGVRPDLPNAPQLSTAAYSHRKKKAPIKQPKPDPAAPELPFMFVSAQPQDGVVRHLNPGRLKRSA